MRCFFYLIGLLLISLQTCLTASEKSCVVDHTVRIESETDFLKYEYACEIRGNLLIFADSVRLMTFPVLKTAKLINIEGRDLEMASFPTLETADAVYATGPKLRNLELPYLTHVKNTLYIKSRRLRFLNFPNLEKIGIWILEGNLTLEEINIGVLYQVGSLHLKSNPLLSASDEATIKGVSHSVKEEE